MKKGFLLALVLVVSVAASAALTMGDVISKSAYDSKGVSADLVQKINLPAQNLVMKINGKIFMKGDSVRVEMIYTADSFNNPAQYMQMKMMKADEMIIINTGKEGAKKSIVIYPKLNGYVETSEEEAGNMGNDMEDIDEMMMAPVEKVGTESFAGISAVKYKVLPLPDDDVEEGEEYFVYVDPSNKLMVGMYITDAQGNETTLEYRNVKAGVDESVFKAPAGLTKYDKMQQMVMSGMQ